MQSKEFPGMMIQFPLSTYVEGKSCYVRMADMGIKKSIFCTVIYAPYRLVMPRYPEKGIYSLEEGYYYYTPEEARYADLPVTPTASKDFAGRDLLEESVSGAHQAGLQAAAWVTMFANGMIAKKHPDWAVHNLYGSADRLYLCFNHPEVREYSRRVCAEVAERYQPEEIMLDKIPQTCLELNSFGGRIDPVLRTLGSFCFCSHCKEAAGRTGIDLDRYQRMALELARQSLAIPPHIVNALASELQGDTEIPLLLLDNPWIMEILNFRIASIRSFLSEVRKAIDEKKPGSILSVCFVPQVKIGHDAASPRAWLGAQSYAAYKDSDADLIHSVIHWDADVVEYDTRRAVNSVEGGLKICTHIKAYGSSRPSDIAGLVRAARSGGADGVGYFCYDLASTEMLEAIKNAQRISERG